MSATKLIRQAVVTEIGRAKAAWTSYPLIVDYENKVSLNLAAQTDPYLLVDVVFRGGDQMDLNPSPLLRVDGQIAIAVGVKEGLGTQSAAELLDFLIPYLQMRTNLLHGVRTHVAVPQPARRADGFYYLPALIGFWRDAAMPATP